MCPPEHNLLLHTEQNLHKLAQSLLLPHFYFLDVQLWMATAQWVKKGTTINCAAGSDLLCLILHAIFFYQNALLFINYLRKHQEIPEFVGNCRLYPL